MIASTHRVFRVGCACLIAAPFLLGGCTCGNDLIAAGRLAAEPHLDQALQKPPEVCDDGGDLVVSGRLENHPRGLGGHIDVTVVAPDGVTLYDAWVNYREDTASSRVAAAPRSGSFRHAQTRHGSYGVYSVRFPGLPPEGSVVKVRYDPGPHPVPTDHPERPQ